MHPAVALQREKDILAQRLCRLTAHVDEGLAERDHGAPAAHAYRLDLDRGQRDRGRSQRTRRLRVKGLLLRPPQRLPLLLQQHEGIPLPGEKRLALDLEQLLKVPGHEHADRVVQPTAQHSAQRMLPAVLQPAEEGGEHAFATAVDDAAEQWGGVPASGALPGCILGDQGKLDRVERFLARGTQRLRRQAVRDRMGQRVQLGLAPLPVEGQPGEPR